MKSLLCSLFRVESNLSCSFLSPLLLTCTLWLGILTSSLAQSIDWQKALGGSKNDSATAMVATPDGGYIVAGSTASNDGDVTGNHGGKHDAWVVKLNSAGTIVWKKAFGGTGDDQASAIAASPDGGYVVTGTTTSSNGDMADFRPTWTTGFDYIWVFKLTGTGEIVWKQARGFSRGLYASAITAAPGGGYAIAGSLFFSGTKNSGRFFYVLTLSEAGDVVWDKYFGDTNGDDLLYAITATTDGGYVLAGKTSSPVVQVGLPTGGDHSTNHNPYVTYDAFVIKLNREGQGVWYKFLGGSGLDYANAVTSTPDGGFLVAGFTMSTDGDVAGNHGGGDAWVVKLSSSGDLIWQKTLGGSGADHAYAITSTGDGGCVVAGTTNSTDGDVSGVRTNDDGWLIKLNSVGQLIGQKPYGGNGRDDGVRALLKTADGGYVTAGLTRSTDGPLSDNHGNGDVWVAKLGGFPSPGLLAMLAPAYSCQTGAITFNTSGGDGSSIIYNAPGIIRSSATSNTGTVEQGLRSDPKPIPITATQNGITVSYTFDFGTYCAGTPPSGGLLTLAQPAYNCQTGAIDFNVSGGDGSPIVYTAPGIIRSATTDRSGTVEPELRSDPKPLRIQATQQGQTTAFIFDFGAYCNGVNPTLTLLAPGYDCATGAIRFITGGGDGTPIEFMAVGITAWTTNPAQFLDAGLRTASDVQPFTLLARQSGRVVSYSWNLKAACGRSRVGSAEQLSALSVLVLGNPVTDAFTVDIGGVEGQSVELRLVDGQGRLVESRSVAKAGATERHTFDLPQQGPGLLFMQISSGNQRKTVKTLKL